MVAFENKGAMAATIVVAASDSLNKAAANYVCDGTADNVEIQAAIDALPAGGGKVVLLEGTYNIIAAIDGTTKPIHYQGQGKATILNNLDDAYSYKMLSIGEYSTVDNIKFKGIFTSPAVRSNDSLRVNNYCVVSNCWFESAERGIYAHTYTKVLVNNCHFYNHNEHGIVFSGGYGNSCTYCHVTNCSFDGNDGVTNRGVYFLESKWCSVSNCSFIGHAAVALFIQSGSEQIAVSGCVFNDNFVHLQVLNDTPAVSATPSRHVTVVGCIFGTSTSSGISLSGTASYEAQYCTVTGNIFLNVNARAISLGGFRNVFSGNAILTGNQDGVSCSGSRCVVTGNTIYGCTRYGIYITGSYNVCSGNIVSNCTDRGIFIENSSYNSIEDNDCFSNNTGIKLLTSSYNVVNDNNVQDNKRSGINLESSGSNVLIGNNCVNNSTIAGYDDISLTTSSYNNIQCNTCRAGGGANKPVYGIDITDAGSVANTVIDNDLYNDGFVTAPFNDTGTNTKINTYKVPLVDGSDPQDSGFLIDTAAEYARTWLRLPEKVNQTMWMKVYGRSVVTEAHMMRGEFVVYGGADNEAYTTHNGSIADHPSESSNFTANDIIHWKLNGAGILALKGGDSIEVKVLHEAAGGDDCETNAYLRTVEIGYV